MKNFVFLTIAIVIVFMALGCSGYARYKNGFETATGYREESGATFFPNPESSIEMAQAELTLSVAEINRELAKKISKNELDDIILGIIINNDTQKTIIYRNPFWGRIFYIEPGGYSFIPSTEMPEEIDIKFSDWDVFGKVPVKPNNKSFFGIKTNYCLRIDSKY